MVASFRKASRKIKTVFFTRAQEDMPEVSFDLHNKVLIGTHHKTGTAWMGSIFREISRNFGLTFFSGEQNGLPENFDIFLQNHSRFNFNQIHGDYKGLHLIRDPRDVIISGCFYHQKSKEKWLHNEKEEFGGLTYQEKINSYESLDDQIMFEMANSGMNNIKKMLGWQYNNPAFLEIKYEDLISDVNLTLFHEVFAFLGFPGKVIPQLLSIAYNNSLFSGNINQSIHVRSGNKKQWEKYFNHDHKVRFLELFDNALVRLGYESNNDWINK